MTATNSHQYATHQYGPPLMTQLPAALQVRIWDHAIFERYKAGQVIHYRGDDRPGLSIVRAGEVDVGTLGRDGTILSIGTLGVGESFGEFSVFADLPRTHDISAVTDSEIAQIPAAKFRTLCAAEPQILSALLKVALIRSHAAFERLDDNARLPLPVRTAKRLLGYTNAANRTADIALTQSDVGRMMGVSRVSISKALSKLAEADLIRLGYGRLYIDDVPRLRAWTAARAQTYTVEPALLTGGL